MGDDLWAFLLLIDYMDDLLHFQALKLIYNIPGKNMIISSDAMMTTKKVVKVAKKRCLCRVQLRIKKP